MWCAPCRYYSVNVPLKDGMDDASFMFLFEPIMHKIMESYQPEAVVLQVGVYSTVVSGTNRPSASPFPAPALISPEPIILVLANPFVSPLPAPTLISPELMVWCWAISLRAAQRHDFFPCTGSAFLHCQCQQCTEYPHDLQRKLGQKMGRYIHIGH